MRNIEARGLAALWLLATLCAPAAALDHDEATDGDLAGQTLLLDIGTHRVDGVATFITAAGGTGFVVDNDNFNVLLPAGVAIVAIRLDATFSDTTQNTSQFEATWWIGSGLGLELARVCLDFVTPACSGAAPSLSHSIDLYTGPPLAEGFYNVGNPWAAGWSDATPGGAYGGELHYRLSFEVQAIPEPGTALMWVLGLAALGGLAVRHQGAARRAG